MAAVVLALAAPAQAVAATSATLRALVERGEHAEAYRQGRAESRLAGDPDFDLVFGTAAVHSGHAAEGVLALERFLLLHPERQDARLELARGYFLVHEDVRAREEFQRALASYPPPAARRVIEEHLEALREREGRHRPTFTGFVEGAFGHDSNPRAGIDDPVVSLPVLGEITIGDLGVRRADATLQYAAGMRATAPVTARVAAFASAQADYVRYDEARDFDQDLYGGTLGAAGFGDTHSWRAGVSAGYQTLGRVPYRRSHGLFADGTRVFGTHAISAGAQWGRLLYEGVNVVRDADFGAVSLAWRRLPSGTWRWAWEVALNAGRERNRSAERQDLSRDVAGGRFGIACTPWDRWSFGAGATYLRASHRAADAVLEVRRSDDYAAIDFAATWRLTRSFALRLELTEARNDSNVALYEYQRRTALVRARYEFR